MKSDKYYSEIRQILEDLPDTWCPTLLCVLVKTCLRKKVFQPGGIEAIMKWAKSEENKNQNKDLTAPTL